MDWFYLVVTSFGASVDVTVFRSHAKAIAFAENIAECENMPEYGPEHWSDDSGDVMVIARGVDG